MGKVLNPNQKVFNCYKSYKKLSNGGDNDSSSYLEDQLGITQTHQEQSTEKCSYMPMMDSSASALQKHHAKSSLDKDGNNNNRNYRRNSELLLQTVDGTTAIAAHTAQIGKSKQMYLNVRQMPTTKITTSDIIQGSSDNQSPYELFIEKNILSHSARG